MDKHAKSKKLNKLEISNYFQSKGYEVICLEQQWRHISGKLRKSNEDFYLKLASTKEAGKRTRNEYEFNRLFNKIVDKEKAPVKIPEVYEKNYYQGLFWYLGEFLEGKVITCENKLDDITLLYQNLRRIAEINTFLLDINFPEPLPNDRFVSSTKEYYLTRLKKQIEWAKKDVSDLENFIRKRIDYLKQALVHGDFAPWHFILADNDDFFLTDAEHSRTKGVKFYDFAYFFQRLYVKLKREDLALNYWKEFKKLYKFNKGDFECLELIISHRGIAAYAEARQDKGIDLRMAERMRGKLIKSRLLL